MTYRLIVLLALLLFGLTKVSRAQQLQLLVQSETKESDSIASVYFQTRFFPNRKALEESLTNSKDSLLKDGYFQHQITRLKTANDTNYCIKFLSGEQTTVFKLKYDQAFVSDYAEKFGLDRTASHIYIRHNDLNAVLEEFARIDTKKGRPLTSYAVQNIRLSNDTAHAVLSIKNNQERKLTEVVVKGYDKFPKSFLTHFTKLKTNTLYDEEKISQSSNFLKELDFVKQSREPEILFSKDSTTLYLYLEKANANLFEGFLGFANQENTNGLRINGYLDLNLNNTLNYGESLEIKFRGNGDNQQQLEASLRIPYLFRSAFSLTPSLRLFRQDSSFSNSQTNLKIDYTWSPTFTINAQAGQIRSTKLEALSTAGIENFTKTIFTTGFETRNPKNSSDPFDTNYLNLDVGFSTRRTEDQLRNLNQLLLNIDAAYTFDFSEKHKFFIKNTTTYISPRNVFKNEMHQLGGMQTLRGYKENALYTPFFTALQTEYRYRPLNSIFLNSVFDSAYYENPLSEKSDLLFGIGLGGSILTNAGWLSLNIVTPFNEKNKASLSSSIIHIQLRVIF
ncbi:hypothetical protein [Leeuwenhoekiella parthenopeia]|uniref:Outer membrane protein n=1 Tax=Leeuwenhoekiella parthenopeia TaxID=2890320 RepID=A0ABS8GRC4_9FLAO|nr:hypothetical protein [Leeuwenhoekiella parthenopeia]MCC4212517.1 hypothetical protein [Leeuwenhoekiella parthenopeia]